MYKHTTGLVLAGILVTGAVGAVAITPASATTSDNVVTSRLAHIKSALSGLVTAGTPTQAPANTVASTLDSQPPLGERGGSDGLAGSAGVQGVTKSHSAAATARGRAHQGPSATVHGGAALPADGSRVRSRPERSPSQMYTSLAAPALRRRYRPDSRELNTAITLPTAAQGPHA